MAGTGTGFELVDGPFDGAFSDTPCIADRVWVGRDEIGRGFFGLVAGFEPAVGRVAYDRTDVTRQHRTVYRYATSPFPLVEQETDEREAVPA